MLPKCEALIVIIAARLWFHTKGRARTTGARRSQHQPSLVPSSGAGTAEALCTKDNSSASAATAPSTPLIPPRHPHHFPSPAPITAPFSHLPSHSPGAASATGTPHQLTSPQVPFLGTMHLPEQTHHPHPSGISPPCLPCDPQGWRG